MKSNPILEEVWRIKDELAREAGYDLHRLCENTRQWAAAHPHPGPRVQNAEELRRVLADLERQRAQESALALNEAPPRQEP
jgi:predicted nucleic acid-binding Zn ribbon protein